MCCFLLLGSRASSRLGFFGCHCSIGTRGNGSITLMMIFIIIIRIITIIIIIMIIIMIIMAITIEKYLGKRFNLTLRYEPWC